MQTRSVLALGLTVLAVLAMAQAARADVVIIEGNDVPLTGRILDEDETSIRFRIRGLKESSFIVIEKSRIRRFWREENTYWDLGKDGESPEQAAEKFDLEKEMEPAKTEPVKTEPPRAASPRPLPAATATQKHLIDRLTEKASRLVPQDPGLRILAWLAVFGGVSMLFFLGGRIAELKKLGLGRSAILSLVTQFLVLMGVLAHRSAREPLTFPLVVAGLLVCWVLTSRMVSGGRFGKSILLLSFTLAVLVMLIGSLFSVMTAA